MSKAAIVFISDIHYSKDREKSQFQENDENEYYQKWENYVLGIEKLQDTKVKYLVISGDLAESARRKEYIVLEKILNRFCDKFSISKNNVLLIPGNHDINRSELESYCDKNDIDELEAEKYYEVKLGNYLEFYERFKEKKNVDISRSILDTIYIEEENILILGINSLAKESHLNHVGYVDLTKLDKEIQEYLGDDKNIFVVTHHSFTDTRERELASIKNVDTLRDALGLKRINTFIYGHHHTSESKKDVVGEQEYELRYIEIGSIGKILENVNGESYNNRFTVAICEQGKLCIHDYNYTAGEWEERNNQKYLNELSIVPKGKTEEVDSKDLPRAKEENSDHEKIDGQGKFPAEKEIYLCNRS